MILSSDRGAHQLAEEFGIFHSTLEFEHPDHAHEDASVYGDE